MNRVYPLLDLIFNGTRAIYRRSRTGAFDDGLDLILLKIRVRIGFRMDHRHTFVSFRGTTR